MTGKTQRYKTYALLPKLRKWTTPVHWLYGALCAFLILSNGILAGWLAMGVFALMEIWNDKEEKARNPAYLPSGCADWWEAFIIYMPGHGVLGLLNYIGVVTISWVVNFVQ
jgi:hypothetical protein